MTEVRPRLRKAAGPPRPTYLRAQDTDRVMSIVLALMSEVASLRQRVDTHERLALTGTAATPEAVDSYRPDAQTDATREAWREAYIKRLMRVVLEEIEPSPSKHED